MQRYNVEVVIDGISRNGVIEVKEEGIGVRVQQATLILDKIRYEIVSLKNKVLTIIKGDGFKPCRLISISQPEESQSMYSLAQHEKDQVNLAVAFMGSMLNGNLPAPKVEHFNIPERAKAQAAPKHVDAAAAFMSALLKG